MGARVCRSRATAARRRNQERNQEEAPSAKSRRRWPAKEAPEATVETEAASRYREGQAPGGRRARPARPDRGAHNRARPRHTVRRTGPPSGRRRAAGAAARPRAGAGRRPVGGPIRRRDPRPKAHERRDRRQQAGRHQRKQKNPREEPSPRRERGGHRNDPKQSQSRRQTGERRRRPTTPYEAAVCAGAGANLQRQALSATHEAHRKPGAERGRTAKNPRNLAAPPTGGKNPDHTIRPQRHGRQTGQDPGQRHWPRAAASPCRAARRLSGSAGKTSSPSGHRDSYQDDAF